MGRILIVVLLSLLATPALARTHRVTQIPHGSKFGCTSCHRTAAGGGDFTPFGSDTILALVGPELLQERDVDWSQVYHLDSDRDGFTNGEELNDPMGLWKIGDSAPIGGVTYNPGDPSSHPISSCGDGRITPPEQCDGTNFGTQTCVGLGLEDGVLRCNPDCSFDSSGCGGEVDEEEPMPEQPTEPSDAGDDDAACSTSPMRRAPPLALLFLFGFGAGLVRQRSRP